MKGTHTMKGYSMSNPLLQEFAISDGTYSSRAQCVDRYSWAIPDKGAIDIICSHTHCLVEVGAGRGYWAHLIAKQGVDVVAYDKDPPTIAENLWHRGSKTEYFPVLQGGPEKLVGEKHRALFLCWPPYNSSLAIDCLKAYEGNTLIFVGEGKGGCTGNDAFFELRDQLFECTKSYWIPQWPGLYDYLYVGKRKH